MYAVRNILVGVDLSVTADDPFVSLPPPTREAVDLALRVARFCRASVTFLCVAEHPDLAPPAGDEGLETTGQSLYPAALELLNSLVNDAEAAGVSAQSRLIEGRGWMELIHAVLRDQHDLVIVGSRNLQGLDRMRIGSVGIKLLRKCPCPVWIARTDTDPHVNTVLVADDLGEVGERCLHAGVLTAKLLDARLFIVHALSYPLESRLSRTGTSRDEIQAYRTKTRNDAEEQLRERLATTDWRTVAHGARLEVIDGPPEIVIPQVIAQHSIDLLVMGTVGRAGIPGMLLGNSAERLLPEVPCSLLALKPEGFESPVTLP